MLGLILHMFSILFWRRLLCFVNWLLNYGYRTKSHVITDFCSYVTQHGVSVKPPQTNRMEWNSVADDKSLGERFHKCSVNDFFSEFLSFGIFLCCCLRLKSCKDRDVHFSSVLHFYLLEVGELQLWAKDNNSGHCVYKEKQVLSNGFIGFFDLNRAKII